MKIIKKENAPRHENENLDSYLLISKLTTGSNNLNVSLSEMKQKGYERSLAVAYEQMYFIIEGTGIVTIEDEDRVVKGGDCIFIPTDTKAGIKNTGTKVLKYLTAANASFSLEKCKENWPL